MKDVIKMATINDVAKRAGVGIATVSRVINNSGYVKIETRKKVEKVIKDMGYKPNEIARSMIKQKNGIVAFVIPTTKHLFFAELVHHVEEELFRYGYKVLLCNSSKKLEKELTYLEMLENNRVDAMIVLTNNDIEGHFKKGMPLISFDRVFKDIPYVASDNYQGGVIAATHLYERGCKNLMYIGDDSQGKSARIITEVSKRRSGFIEQAKKLGYSNIIDIEYPLDDYTSIPKDVEKRIHQHPEVDGIFCISDSVAAEVILSLINHGRNVPKDVKVIGFDGGMSFINLGMKMTSIVQEPKALAIAIKDMIEAYYRKEEKHSKILPVSLSIGETT